MSNILRFSFFISKWCRHVAMFAYSRSYSQPGLSALVSSVHSVHIGPARSAAAHPATIVPAAALTEDLLRATEGFFFFFLLPHPAVFPRSPKSFFCFSILCLLCTLTIIAVIDGRSQGDFLKEQKVKNLRTRSVTTGALQLQEGTMVTTFISDSSVLLISTSFDPRDKYHRDPRLSSHASVDTHSRQLVVVPHSRHLPGQPAAGPYEGFSCCIHQIYDNCGAMV